MRTLAASVVLLIGATPASHAQADAARFAPVRDTIEAILASSTIASITVAVSQGDRILWEEGFGFADRARSVRATPETMYSLASISKPFTATALMRLVQDGVLDLDQPANAWLGASMLRAHLGDARDMTLRRILSHSAGLPLHYQFFYDGIAEPHSDDVAIAKYGFAGYPPGETYFYSNLGYGVLGHVIGRVTGSSYEAVLRERVFTPLGMRHATVSTGKGLANAAIRYDNARNPIPPYAFDHTAASGVWASAHDLVRFGMFHAGAPNQPALLSPALVAQMQRAHAPETAPGASYGLGWGTLENDNGYRRVSHTGGMPGVSTVLNLYPEERVAIVVLANAAGAPVGRVANAIAAIVLPNYAANREAQRAAATAAAATRTTPPASPPGPARFVPPDAMVGTWRGMVQVDSARVALELVIPPDGPIRARLAGQDATLIAPSLNASGWFSGRLPVALRAPDATPSVDSARVAVTLSLRARDRRLTGWASSISQTPLAFGAVSFWTELTKASER